MAEKNKRKRRLTEKEKKLIEERTKNPNATLRELGVKAGYSKRTPAQKAHRALNSPPVQESLRAAMERDPALCRTARLKKLKEGMSAEKTQFFQSDGRVMDERTCVDFPTRKSYLELAGKLCGDLVEKHEHKFDGPLPFKLEYSDERGDKAPQVPKPGDKGKP